MNAQEPFKIYYGEAALVVVEIMEQLEAAGMQVVKSFDLRSACASFTDNICPHHGTSPCDCQLIVLLIYGIENWPISLILHSHRGQTELQWDVNPGAYPGPESRALIQSTLIGGVDLFWDVDQERYAGVD